MLAKRCVAAFGSVIACGGSERLSEDVGVHQWAMGRVIAGGPALAVNGFLKALATRREVQDSASSKPPPSNASSRHPVARH